MFNGTTRIIDLTVAELREIVAETTRETVEATRPPENAIVEEKFCKGIEGLANLLGCSTRYAQKLKSEGIFDDALIQVGRIIHINKIKALRIWAEFGLKKRR